MNPLVTFNRTYKELKLDTTAGSFTIDASFNRTYKELKQYNYTFADTSLELLIAPTRNWNSVINIVVFVEPTFNRTYKELKSYFTF